MTNLEDVGVGFASLLYDLPENTGFDDFHTKCELVLDALRRRSYLTNNMVKSCLYGEHSRRNFIEFVDFSQYIAVSFI